MTACAAHIPFGENQDIHWIPGRQLHHCTAQAQRPWSEHAPANLAHAARCFGCCL